MPAATKPTLEQFKKYQAAYDWFNRQLFGNKLKPCLLVFRDGKKKKNCITLGHFGPHRWTKGEETCHEISLNPETLHRDFEDTMSTLVHEMVHQWQEDHGEPPRAAYHDKQWAAMMCEVGLIPSDTGEPGGKQTGQRMTHYIEKGGRFATAFKSMPNEIKLPWTTGGVSLGIRKPKEPAAKNKIKYTCAGCDTNVWGKPGLKIVCGECEEQFSEVEAD